MYLLRLDDASEYMYIINWERLEQLLDRYNIKPIFGIIPANKDPELLAYGKVDKFWEKAKIWEKKGWTAALHGYTHVFESNNGGINPVNMKSEYAGLTYEKQCQKIKQGYEILQRNGIIPQIFFAPAHTFDTNTLRALKEVSGIRIISDTIANDIYYNDGFYYIPQQSGHCRRLPFRITTFCYHPNTMTDDDFIQLENFLRKYNKKFGKVDSSLLKKRKFGFKDAVLKKLYFIRKRIVVVNHISQIKIKERKYGV
ncbi:MAG: DUF2334 domain-containing protein [Intestinibacter sp.]